MSATMLSDTEGQSLAARIHTRKRLAQELAAADDAHTAAVQAAVGGYGDWSHARQAAEVVRQCRAALACLDAPATNDTTGTL